MENWKQKIQRLTGWSDGIIGFMRSEEEAQVYIVAGLKEASVGGRPALIRTDIDWAAFNCRHEWLRKVFAEPEKWKGYNNADLVGEGFPPRDANGDEYQLHHIGQQANSPLAELTGSEHQENYAVLHWNDTESQIDRLAFNKEKSLYWQDRFRMFTKAELNDIYT